MTAHVLPSSSAADWYAWNQQALTAELHRVRAMLAKHSRKASAAAHAHADRAHPDSGALEGFVTAFDRIRTLFRLSPFESDVVLLCAGMELDAELAGLCGKTGPTFSLALSALSDPHWSALSPERPLRRWRLIEIGTGAAMTTSPLRLDERILNYLVGVEHRDERLWAILEPVAAPTELVQSHARLARSIAFVWQTPRDTGLAPGVQLIGSEAIVKRAVAATAAGLLDQRLETVTAQALPTAPAELDRLIRLMERECLLRDCMLLLDCTAEMTEPAIRLIDRIQAPLFVSTAQRHRSMGRTLIDFAVDKPDPEEQRSLWNSALTEAPGELVDALVSQFNLSPPDIRAAALAARQNQGEPAQLVWDACRSQVRLRLDDLAQRIDPRAAWEQLVLPDAQRRILNEITVHVRQRATVYERWGFAKMSARGLGVSALFAGASGTGKTMAAEALAHELRLDLYRIDLSAVVSKYIGETEKNLRRVFDTAEESGAILLFDEADAVFGRRTEVRDSHDRYANIEVSYLLQRIESYRGLALLTTNLKEAIDPAFVRRIRFTVLFPFPDPVQRAEIWRHAFPPDVPLAGLDFRKLAQLSVSGGGIRNIALRAAFAAADAREPVQFVHLLRAARAEYEKIEKALPENEVRGWI